MKQPAIIVETSKGNMILPVTNFSKEACVNQLSALIHVDPDKIVQVRASADYGIYAIKEIFPTAREWHTSTVKFSTNEYDTYFIVNYGYILNKRDSNLYPTIMDYKNYLESAVTRFGISLDEARTKFGMYTYKEWNNLLYK